jgi:hypothetical protein
VNFLKQIEDIDPMNYHFDVTLSLWDIISIISKSFICDFRCFKLIENFFNLGFEKNFFKSKKNWYHDVRDDDSENSEWTLADPMFGWLQCGAKACKVLLIVNVLKKFEAVFLITPVERMWSVDKIIEL